MTGVSVELGCRPDLQGKKWEENQGHAGKIWGRYNLGCKQQEEADTHH
jgi:hypothetical protein